jgi:hypothetical protein
MLLCAELRAAVLIRMTDETLLLLAPRDKFLTLIFDRKYSVVSPNK